VSFCPHSIALGVLLAGATGVSAQETENPQVVVQAEAGEIPSAYGAPPDLSHARISALTKSYVLSPFSFEHRAPTPTEKDVLKQVHALNDPLIIEAINLFNAQVQDG